MVATHYHGRGLDRRAYKGADFLLLRRAANGTTVFDSIAPVSPWKDPV